MNLIPQPEPAAVRPPVGDPSDGPTAGSVRARPGAVVVPFPAGSRPHRVPSVGEARGEILLFLGVRYERLAS